MSVFIICWGISEFKNKKKKRIEKVRNFGGGCKKVVDENLDLKKIFEDIIELDIRGDFEILFRWICKSVRNISDFFEKKGFFVSY